MSGNKGANNWKKRPEEHEDGPVDPTTLRTTSVASYLIIARYNRDTFKSFESQASPDPRFENRQQEAHEAAEELFPEHDEAEKLRKMKGEGWLLARSFHSDLHAAIKRGLIENEALPSPRVQAEVVDEIVRAEMAREPRPVAAGTEQIPDPFIGWVMVIEADKLAAFRSRFGPSGALWEMYDIEVIPLHGDSTTQDIYEFMTPVNWQK